MGMVFKEAEWVGRVQSTGRGATSGSNPGKEGMRPGPLSRLYIIQV